MVSQVQDIEMKYNNTSYSQASENIQCITHTIVLLTTCSADCYISIEIPTNRLLGYEKVYLPLCQVADTPFHIPGGEIRGIQPMLVQCRPTSEL